MINPVAVTSGPLPAMQNGLPTPINAIPNPAAIVKQTNATAATVAHIVITPPTAFPKGLDASDLYWTFDKGAQFTQNAASFYPAMGADKNRGLTVSIYGVNAGPIRLDVYLLTQDGKNPLVETYDAIVVNPKVVYYRVQLLHGVGGDKTKVSTAGAISQIALANVYLRQAGISLQPDPITNTTFAAPGISVAARNAAANATAGVYNLTITQDAAPPVKNMLFGNPTEDDFRRSIPLLNDRPGVIQIIYVDHPLNADNNFGVTLLAPPNSNYSKDGFQVSYRPGSAKKYLDKPMTMFAPTQQIGKAWGLYLFGTNAAPGNNFTASAVYAQTLADEMGHILGLAHRDPDLIGNDNLYFPGDNGAKLPVTNPNYNLMSIGFKGDDFDLIQVLAMQGSSAIGNPIGG